MRTLLEDLEVSRDRRKALRELTDAETEVWKRLICQAKDSGHTYKEVGKAAGVHPSRVAQIMGD